MHWLTHSRSRTLLVGAALGALAAALAGCALADSNGGDRTAQAEVGHPSSGPFSAVNSGGWATATWPQGAAFVAGEGSDLQVAVYAAHATRVLLEIYPSAIGASAQFDYAMAKGADGIWRAQVASVPGKSLYGFRAWGPNWPFSASWAPGSSAGFVTDVDAAGDRYNPNKLLSDPYGRELSHDKTSPAMLAAGHGGGMYGTGAALYHGVARRSFDTGPWAPKSVALASAASTGARPAIAPRDSVVYEAHVRGLTAHASAMSLTTLLAGIPGFAGVVNAPSGCRGTYLAAGMMAPYLQGLGVNVIELLPVHEADNDTNPLDHAGGNYWSYVTDDFFAPDRHDACDKSLGGPTAEFKAMVKAFHDHGIEVWLDVVYNHTGEGGNWDATKQVAEVTGLRGFDNIDFYQLPADKASYFDTTGVANNVNVATAAGRRLVLDSLRYWGLTMGVDGFRFDLACELGRDAAPAYGFNPGAQLLVDIASFAGSNGLDVIAEPWDLGAYGVGQFPSGWGEWNGKYRDATRRFFKGDLGGANGATYADAFYGDFTDYNDQGGAAKSVNFLVAHDGFTLADLVSYGARTNAARSWPFGPSDGGSDGNDSWDSDGDHALRRQRYRSLFAWQMFSRGVPMIVAGDEFARTQNGNNNPYNVDGAGTWNNYAMIATDSPHAVATGVSGGEAYHNNFATDAHADGKNALFQFARQLIHLRRSSRALRQADYAMAISFSKNDGSAGFDSHTDRAVRIRLDGSAVGDADYLLYVNNWTGTVTFALPAPDAGKHWVRVVDTAAWAESHDNFWTDAEADAIAGNYDVHPWSVVVLKAIDP